MLWVSPTDIHQIRHVHTFCSITQPVLAPIRVNIVEFYVPRDFNSGEETSRFPTNMLLNGPLKPKQKVYGIGPEDMGPLPREVLCTCRQTLKGRGSCKSSLARDQFLINT